MRGVVYRLGGRSRSIFVGLGLAAALSCAASEVAAGKAPAAAKAPAKPPRLIAHPAGHKIA